MNYLEALQQRYSVKKFDPNKIIPKEHVENILQAGKLSASSLGLQPYRVIVVESSEAKSKLVPAFYNPSQISTCSHLLVIVSKKGIDEQYIKDTLDRSTKSEKLHFNNWSRSEKASIRILRTTVRLKS